MCVDMYLAKHKVGIGSLSLHWTSGPLGQLGENRGPTHPTFAIQVWVGK